MTVETRDQQYTLLVRLFSSSHGPTTIQCSYQKFDCEAFTADLIRVITAPWGFDPKKHLLNAVLPSLQGPGVRVVDLVENADVLVLQEPPRSILMCPKTETDMHTWYAREEEALIQRLLQDAADRKAQRCIKQTSAKQTSQELDRQEHAAIENAFRQHMKDRGPQGTRVVGSGAWILYPGQQTESSERDIIVTHAQTSFSYPPLPNPKPNPAPYKIRPFSNDANGVKSKYAMVLEGDIMLHTEVKAPCNNNMINSAEKQLTSSNINGFQNCLSMSNGACKWFPDQGCLRSILTTVGVLSNENRKRSDEMLRKLLTTRDFSSTHVIAVVGWGFFLRHENGFVAVPGAGLSFFVLDQALAERQDRFGSANRLAAYMV